MCMMSLAKAFALLPGFSAAAGGRKKNTRGEKERVHDIISPGLLRSSPVEGWERWPTFPSKLPSLVYFPSWEPGTRSDWAQYCNKQTKIVKEKYTKHKTWHGNESNCCMCFGQKESTSSNKRLSCSFGGSRETEGWGGPSCWQWSYSLLYCMTLFQRFRAHLIETLQRGEEKEKVE